MTKKSKMILGLASMLGVSAGATAVSGFAWFTTTKSATLDISNIGVYSKSSALAVELTTPVKGCIDSTTDPSDTGDINVVASAQKTQNFTGDGVKKVFTLDLEPYETPTATVGGASAALTWTSGKTITFTDIPANNAAIVVTYKTHSVLTDISSVNGQQFYKPAWTAGHEGVFATDIDPVTEGYLSFTMTLTANGSSDLKVYLNQASILGADEENNDADEAAADITRVALIEDASHYLVLQRGSVATNNKGINQTYIDAAASKTNGLYDLSKLNETVESSKFAIPDTADKGIESVAPAMTAAKNYVCSVEAGQSKVITVAVWLEGTSHINAYGSEGEGAYAVSPEDGTVNISLPLIAF